MVQEGPLAVRDGGHDVLVEIDEGVQLVGRAHGAGDLAVFFVPDGERDELRRHRGRLRRLLRRLRRAQVTVYCCLLVVLCFPEISAGRGVI